MSHRGNLWLDPAQPPRISRRISPLTSHSYHVQHSTGCLHWSIFQGSLKRLGSFCNVFPPLPCSSWKREASERPTLFQPCQSVFSAFFSLFPFLRPIIHRSNQLTKSCMDFLSFIFWSKNMIMIVVQTEINTLRELKGIRYMKNRNHSSIVEDLTRRLQVTWMRHEEQEISSFKHCMKVNQSKSAWNIRRNKDNLPELQPFVMVLAITQKHQTANVWLYLKPAAEDLVVQSVLVRCFRLTEWVFTTTSIFLCVKSTLPKDVAISSKQANKRSTLTGESNEN